MSKVSIGLLANMDTLTKILSGSSELFSQYGFKTITMDDIARRVGISKKTLYQHFANKQEVVLESVMWLKNQIYEQCLTAMETSENAIEAMVRVMHNFDQMHRNINPIALLEMERFYPEVFTEFKNKMLEEDVITVRGNIERGIGEGLYRSAINADFMARYRMEISLLSFHSNMMVNDKHDMPTVAHDLSEHFLYGIMTQKGEKLYIQYKEQYLKQVSRI